MLPSIHKSKMVWISKVKLRYLPIFLILVSVLSACSSTGKGLAAFDRGDYSEGLFFLHKGFQEKDPNATLYLGYIYAFGLDVLRDLDRARYYANKAAEYNSSSYSFFDKSLSLLLAATMILDGDSSGDEHAVQVVRNEYYRNNMFANWLLARCYLDGIGIDQNYTTALALFENGVRADNQFLILRYAWVLATYPESSVRDGQKALSLVESLEFLEEGSSFSLLAVTAAAHAEMGDFNRAVEQQLAAIDDLRLRVDAQPQLRPLLDRYVKALVDFQSNKALRERVWFTGESTIAL